MEYSVQLANEKVKKHQVTALHLTCALAFTGCGAIMYVYNQDIKLWGGFLLLFGFGLLALTMGKNKLVTSTPNNSIFRVVELLISLLLAGYCAYHQWKLPVWIFGVLAAAVGFALFWERASNTIQLVQLSEEGIKLPVESRRRSIPWVDVENVLLRYGTLSIDCVDNKLYQWNVRPAAFDHDDFEAFCTGLVMAHKHKRRKDDW
jgi:FtsH-binding integral membrane protein